MGLPGISGGSSESESPVLCRSLSGSPIDCRSNIEPSLELSSSPLFSWLSLSLSSLLWLLSMFAAPPSRLGDSDAFVSMLYTTEA